MNMVAAPGAQLVEVRLVEFPVELHAAVEEHVDELLREFSHIANSRAQGDTRIPGRLVSLVEQVRAQYSPVTGVVRADIEQARRLGRRSVELCYRVPPSVREATEAMSEHLDEADRFCEGGQMLTLASPPEHRAFRHWFLGEFGRQVTGEPPTPWPVFRAAWSDG